MLDSDLEAFARNFENTFGDDFIKWIKAFILREAFRVANRAAKRTPVDTGALRASWFVGNEQKEINLNKNNKAFAKMIQQADITSVFVDGNNYLVVIGNSREYASFVEYGTMNKDGSVRYRAKFMVSIPIREVAEEMPSRFNKAFTRYIKERGF